MTAINQKQVLKQLQKLSPQQIQMIKLLELPTMQLEQRVKQEIEENPVLEEEQSQEEANEDEGMPKEVSMDEYMREAETPAYKSYVNNHSRDDKERQTVLFEGHSMHDYLTEQLSYRDMPSDLAGIALYIIGNIDEDGYMRLDLQSIADDIAFNYGQEIAIPELEKGLKIVQSLEPPGVGARDLRECLILQLERKAPQSDVQKLALKILQNYFEESLPRSISRRLWRVSVSGKSSFAMSWMRYRGFRPSQAIYTPKVAI